MLNKPTIVQKLQKKNKYGRPGTPLTKCKKIINHYTGQHDVPGINTVNYFNNGVANGCKVNGKYIYASSHYVIDLDGTIYQLIPTNEISYCSNSANSYSVSIEVATTGEDNHYTDATYKSMVWLNAWLCQYKGLDCIKDMLTHTDIVGKNYKLCPIYFVKNPKKWEQFKLDCANLKAGYITLDDVVNCTNGKGKVTVIPNTTKTKYVRIISENVNIHSSADFNSSSVVGKVKKGEVYTVSEKIERTGTDMYKLKSGVYITASTKYVEVFEK